MTQRLVLLFAVFASLLAAGCAYERKPEERTDDGLVRVPSRSAGGVYRAPGASFNQYKRIILEPPTIAFASNWRDKHPDVTDGEVMKLTGEAVKLFHEEFKRELINRGPYEFAEAPAADVLLITPRVVELDIPAPDVASTDASRTFTPTPLKMQVVGELRDAESNALLGRIIVIEGQSQYAHGSMREANRATNAHEMRVAFGKWSMMVREALNVAKAGRPL